MLYSLAFLDAQTQPLRQKSRIISADIENQINQLESNEKKNYMEVLGIKQTGLDLLIQKGYKILELDTFFTSITARGLPSLPVRTKSANPIPVLFTLSGM